MRQQGRKGSRGVRRVDEGIVVGGRPRLRIQRQAVPDRRIARDQITTLAAQKPQPRLPSAAVGGARDGQYMADHPIETLLEHPGQTLALHWILQFGLEW